MVRIVGEKGSVRTHEVFYSIQGEGRYAGIPCYFIRTSGCNLACSWCDTKYANKGENVPIDTIIEEIEQSGLSRHIVITGGEPLMQKNTDGLIRRLKSVGYNIEVETNGTYYVSDIINLAHWNISPKLGSSGMKDKLNKEVLGLYNKHDNVDFKFVIQNKKDFYETKELCEELGLKNIILMPEGTTSKDMIEKTKWLVDIVKIEYSKARVVPRLHTLLYGNKRGI